MGNAFWGADTQRLLDCGRAMQAAGRRVDELAEQLDTVVRSVEWTGPDADGFRATFRQRAAAGLSETGSRLDSGADGLFRHAAQQDAASSVDGETIDVSVYGDLLGGQSWSDIINAAQDLWEMTPFDDPLTIDDLGGRYVDSPEGQGFDPASVPLTAEAIKAATMRQGSLGDCWFLASLSSVAQTDPQFLADNMRLNSDGTWTVRLYDDGEPVDIQVKPDQIARNGARIDDDGDQNYWNDDALGYMSIYEQALINHLGPDYESVIADTPSRGLEIITGADSQSTELWGQPSAAELEAALAEGRPISVMTDPIKPFDGNLSAAHVYQVQKVEGNEVVLINPWGNTGKPEDGAMPQVVRVPLDSSYANKIVMTGVGGRPEDFGRTLKEG